MLIVADGGNRLHAPANSPRALLSAYIGGADAALFEVRACADGVLVAAASDAMPGAGPLISQTNFRDLQAFDVAANWLPRDTADGSFSYNDPTVPGRRLRLPRFDDLIDGLPRAMALMADVSSLSDVGIGELIDMLAGRQRLARLTLVATSPSQLATIRTAHPGIATALRATSVPVAAGSGADLLVVPADPLRSGSSWTAAWDELEMLRDQGEWPMGVCLTLGDTPPPQALLEDAAAANLWGIAGGSTFDLAALRRGYVHTDADFAGTAIDRRQFALGYAKANRFANVTCDDGVHIEIAAYDGDLPNWQGSALERRVERLEWDLINVAREWPFYSGGGLGTVRGIHDDFSAEVTYRVANVGQATTLEMAVINVDPGSHQSAPPTSFRNKDSFYDPHGAPPFAGVEHDEDDGFRINWNLGTEYDNNQYGPPVGEGRTPRGARMMLQRRGAYFAAYYRDPVDVAGGPLGPRDWVCVGVTANESLNRTVFLRCVGKRWRQEKESDPSEYEPILPNKFTFRDLRITCFPAAEGD